MKEIENFSINTMVDANFRIAFKSFPPRRDLNLPQLISTKEQIQQIRNNQFITKLSTKSIRIFACPLNPSPRADPPSGLREHAILDCSY